MNVYYNNFMFVLFLNILCFECSKESKESLYIKMEKMEGCSWREREVKNWSSGMLKLKLNMKAEKSPPESWKQFAQGVEKSLCGISSKPKGSFRHKGPRRKNEYVVTVCPFITERSVLSASYQVKLLFSDSLFKYFSPCVSISVMEKSVYQSALIWLAE